LTLLYSPNKRGTKFNKRTEKSENVGNKTALHTCEVDLKTLNWRSTIWWLVRNYRWQILQM